MKRYQILFPLFIFIIMLIAACKEDKLSPINDDGHAPKAIANIEVENIAGGAKIKYSPPDDNNLLYVKAVYNLKGVKMEAKASYYKNFIVIEGFGDTNEREISLYAVSRSEKLSEAVNVKIKPLPAPVYNVFNSLKIQETFGGILISFENLSALNGGVNTNVVIGALLWDTKLNEWKSIDIHYSGLVNETYSIRGLASNPYKFGFYLKDRWDNHTDTLKVELTPIYEVALDKAKWADLKPKNYPIPQIGVLPASGNPMVLAVDYSSSYKVTNLWDNKPTTLYHTKQAVEQPVWIPIDLGVTAKLSRYKIWQRGTSTYAFNHGNPHEWEIYGTNTPSIPDSWVLLEHRIMEKPSGLPVGTNSNDDIAIAEAGQEYDFPLGIPAVRYIAWKHIDCWAAIEGQSGFLHLGELSLWGQLK